MTTDAGELTAQLQADQIGPELTNWSPWPGGWRNEIATSLIDAVFSARAVYRTDNDKGIHGVVSTWRNNNPDTRDSLRLLQRDIDQHGPLEWAAAFRNTQHSPGRARRRPDTPWKSATVRDACEQLLGLGIETSRDLEAQPPDAIDRALKLVPGVGDATSTYFFMLLGVPGVKADIMIRRYVGRSLNLRSPATTKSAKQLVTTAAERNRWSLLDLEHSIWAYERARTDQGASQGPGK